MRLSMREVGDVKRLARVSRAVESYTCFVSDRYMTEHGIQTTSVPFAVSQLSVRD